MENIISVKDISKTFHRNSRDNTVALSDVSFEVYKGEILGVVGQSGCGKSTLARIMAGLIKPTKGVLELNGSIQMVFQNPIQSFDPRHTLEYSVAEGLKNKHVPKAEIEKRVSNLFNLCGLDVDLKDKYPHQVSGGQCQRAAIARALIMEPDILICDEATSALDVTVQKQIIDLLMHIKAHKDLTIIFISHNLPLVEMFCERAIILKEGKLCKIYQKKTEPIG